MAVTALAGALLKSMEITDQSKGLRAWKTTAGPLNGLARVAFRGRSKAVLGRFTLMKRRWDGTTIKLANCFLLGLATPGPQDC